MQRLNLIPCPQVQPSSTKSKGNQTHFTQLFQPQHFPYFYAKEQVKPSPNLPSDHNCFINPQLIDFIPDYQANPTTSYSTEIAVPEAVLGNEQNPPGAPPLPAPAAKTPIPKTEPEAPKEALQEDSDSHADRFEYIWEHSMAELFEIRINRGKYTDYIHPAHCVLLSSYADPSPISVEEQKRLASYDVFFVSQKKPDFWPSRVWDDDNWKLTKQESKELSEEIDQFYRRKNKVVEKKEIKPGPDMELEMTDEEEETEEEHEPSPMVSCSEPIDDSDSYKAYYID